MKKKEKKDKLLLFVPSTIGAFINYNFFSLVTIFTVWIFYFFDHLKLIYPIVVTIPVALFSIFELIVIIVCRRRIDKFGNLYYIKSTGTRFSPKSYYSSFNINDIKQIIFVRTYTETQVDLDWFNCPRLGSPFGSYNIHLNSLVDNKMIPTGIDEKRFEIYLKGKGKYNRTKYRLNNNMQDNQFYNDGLYKPYSFGEYYVFCFSDKVTDFSFEQFRYERYDILYASLNQENRSKLLGFFEYNHKLMSKIYNKVKVENIILSYPNNLIDKNKYSEVYCIESNTKDFYDFSFTDYFECSQDRKKYMFYQYLKDEFPDQEFGFQGVFDYDAKTF